MNVLVTGGNGQLGLSLKKLGAKFPSIVMTFTDVEDLDITSMNDLEAFLSVNEFQFLINCAAYTAVDKAEEQAEVARRINTSAVENLARLSVKYNYTLIQISTDYVFDGKNHKPYTENYPTGPMGVYAVTKRDAEQIALNLAPSSIIMRTSWLYSEFGNNFVKTILRLACERDLLNIVADQIGTPTYASDLAHAILTVISKYDGVTPSGIYHFSNEGVASWYDFACEIVELAGLKCKVMPIPTEAYPLPAPRPYYSVLNKAKFSNAFHYEIPYWKTSLRECLIQLDRLK